MTPPPAPRSSKVSRHRRYKRITAAVSLLAIVGFVWVATRLFHRDDDPDAATAAFLERVAGHIEQTRKKTGSLPRDFADLVALDDGFHDVLPRDAYGRRLVYEIVDAEAGTFRLVSPGPDGVAGTPDDVVWP